MKSADSPSSSSDDEPFPRDFQAGTSPRRMPQSIHDIKQLKTQQHKQMGNAQFTKYLKAHPGLDKAMFDIERLWHSEQIPEFYTQGFISTLKLHDLDVILEEVRNELALTKQYKSTYYKILEYLRSRQTCLEKIRSQIGIIDRSNILRLFKRKYTRDTEADRIAQQAKIEGYGSLEVKVSPEDSLQMIKNLFIDMCRLREITVYTVEVIHKWRQRVQLSLAACHQPLSPVFFLINDESYYELMRTDTNFIWDSVLSNYIYFAWDCDIFLVRNVLSVEGLAQKELLEKYFLDVVYPKQDTIFDKAIEAMEYLSWKRPQKVEQEHNIEELLVRNYLKMSYSPERIAKEKEQEEQQNRRLFMKENAKEDIRASKFMLKKLDLQKRLHTKLGKIKKLEQEVTGKKLKIKPFNIVNYAAKKSLELQFQERQQKIDFVPKDPFASILKEQELKNSEQKDDNQPQKQDQSLESPKKAQKHLQFQSPSSPNIMIQTQESHPKQTVQNLVQLLQKSSKHKHLLTRKDLYKLDEHSRSLEKLKLQKSFKKSKQKESTQANPLLSIKAQINTILSGDKAPPTHTLVVQQNEETSNKPRKLFLTARTAWDEIEVQQGFQPINRRMFDIFGTIPIQTQRKSKKKFSQQQGIQTQRNSTISPFKREHSPKLRKLSQFIKNQNQKNNFKIHRKKEFKLQLAEKPQNLYEQYAKVQQNTEENKDNQQTTSPETKQETLFLSLQPKTVPLEIIEVYLQHLFTITNPVLALFTDYNQQKIMQKIKETPRVFIFQILDRSSSNVGTIIITEYVSKIGFVKYTVEFIHVDKFQYFVRSILILSEQIFHKTCAEEVVLFLKIDKMDEISLEFGKVINKQFQNRATILQKQLASYLGHNIFERLYIIRRELDNKLQTLKENYDTRLSVKASAFLFSSNFKLRKMSYMTRHFHQTTRQIKLNISLLYSRLLQKIVTKHHLRLLKQASPNIKELLVQLHKAVSIEDYDKILVREFNSTEDLRGYLEYREYDSQQRLLEFLQDSKFIMKKELVLAEFQIDTKLDFLAWQTICRVNGQNSSFVILENYRKYEIQTITSSDFAAEMTFVPCVESGYYMILMSGNEYLQLDTDLYTYLFSFLQTQFTRKKEVLDTITIPQALFRHKITESDTLAEQFPERQFYYSGHVQIETTQNMQLGIIRQPQGLVFELPLIVGFFNKGLEICYVLEPKHYRKREKS